MELSDIKNYLVVFALFLIIDLPMITTINGDMYQKQFLRINKQPIIIGSHTWISAIMAYLLLAFGIYYFAVKPELVKSNINYTNVFVTGILLGLTIYGIYNGTNMATINEWGVKEFIIDTIWGSSLSGILSISSLYVIKNLLN